MNKHLAMPDNRMSSNIINYIWVHGQHHYYVTVLNTELSLSFPLHAYIASLESLTPVAEQRDIQMVLIDKI